MDKHQVFKKILHYSVKNAFLRVGPKILRLTPCFFFMMKGAYHEVRQALPSDPHIPFSYPSKIMLYLWQKRVLAQKNESKILIFFSPRTQKVQKQFRINVIANTKYFFNLLSRFVLSPCSFYQSVNVINYTVLHPALVGTQSHGLS